MVRITEQLIRKKSEHNELMISTLEELSLHQEDIERIEHLKNWCRNLKILLLQNNLIAKIENVFKLKNLEYLNLAINNIEKIENLEELESLTKLDLTLNFIGVLTSVDSLKKNYNLKQLTLTGNPCTDFDGYRDYVIATLPQLECLDSIEIKRSDRLEFWKKKSEHCPETRTEISNQHRKSKKLDKKENDQPKRVRKLFADCGRPYNINEARIPFRMVEEIDRYELDLDVYRYLDTSLINVDLESNYVSVTIKGKLFQIALRDEIKIEQSTSQRSLTTGHLLITMPKLNYKAPIQTERRTEANRSEGSTNHNEPKNINETVDYKNIVKHEVNQHQHASIASKHFEEGDIPSEIPLLI